MSTIRISGLLRKLATPAALCLLVLAGVTLHTQTRPEVAFKAAMDREVIDGDLKGAIEEYKKVVAAAGSNRALAAQALLKIAEAYQKLGDAQAPEAYARLVRDYADQRDAVATARTRLAALQSHAAGGGISLRKVYAGEGINGRVSPDGKWVSFTDWSTGPGNLAIRDLVSGTKRVLTQRQAGSDFRSYANGSVVSPDGRQVAYLWVQLPEYEFQVRIVPTDGSADPRIVHRSRNYLAVKDWTPDGMSLLVMRSFEDQTWQIALVAVRDGSIRQIKSLGWVQVDARISPDGRYIAYDVPAGDGIAHDIFILTADGSQEMPIVQHPANDHSTIWSPDGSRLLFISDRTTTPSLWSVPVKDGKPAGAIELVKNDIGTVVPLTMTRNGTLYYNVRGYARLNVYRAALGNDGKVSGVHDVLIDTHVNSNFGASLSLDGKRLAYFSNRPEPVLVIRDLSSGQERDYPLNLRIYTLYFNGPGWLPDGRSVLLQASDNQRPGTGLYRVELDTGKAEEVGPAQFGFGFRASPDGTAVFYNQEGGALTRFDLATREVTIVRDTPVSIEESEIVLSSPAISRDGSRLAYVHRDIGKAGGNRTEIVVDTPTGGEPRVIFRYPGPAITVTFNTLSWSPDDRHILFVTEEQNVQTIWRVPVDGGAAEQMGVSMNARIKAPQIEPGGRGLIFSTNGAGSDEIWALENFLPGSSTQ
jgi:Tol biopolymer transport system component